MPLGGLELFKWIKSIEMHELFMHFVIAISKFHCKYVLLLVVTFTEPNVLLLLLIIS